MNQTEMQGHLKGGAIKAYMLAGRATVTVVNPKTGGRFTYRVRGKDRAWFVDLLVGPSNEADYRYIGFISRSSEQFVTKQAPSTGVRAFAWLWERVRQGRGPETAEVLHEGHCGRCGRRLTTPESIESGIGPVCAARGAA